jgi:hypothetical protein
MVFIAISRLISIPAEAAACHMAFAEMTRALNRVSENRDSHSPTLLQLERYGLTVEVDPQRIQEAFDRDPPHSGAPTRS